MHILVFLVSMALLIGGFVVMAYGFAAKGMEAVVYGIGFFMVIASVLVPVEYGYRGNRTRG